jgi:hypothetical protein
MRSGNWRLLAGYAASYGIQFQANVLSRFYGAADRLAYEGRDFDSALLYFQNYGPAGWQLC